MARERSRAGRRWSLGVEGLGSSWQLESRFLLSRAGLRGLRQQPAVVRSKGNNADNGLPSGPKPYVQTGVVNGGTGAIMTDTDGELYVAHLAGGGTVRAKAVRGGKVDLFLYGTFNSSVLTIDPASPTPGVNTAHDFPLGSEHHDTLLHIRNITVKNGRIGQILGYKTADVSGQINLLGKDQTGPVVDRIAFFSLLDGASILTPGDLNTLDIFNTISINTGPGIRVGRDLNWMYVGSDLNLQNGSSILIGRDLGLKLQGAKGTGFPGQGALIRGNLIVGTGSTIAVGRYVDAPIIVEGSSSGISNLPPNVQSATVVFGTRG